MNTSTTSNNSLTVSYWLEAVGQLNWWSRDLWNRTECQLWLQVRL